MITLLLAATIISTPIVDRAHHEIRFTAVAQPGALEKTFAIGGVKGHHAIVWKGGSAHTRALFVSDASDHDVRVALNALGAKAGENLTEDSWNARDDASNHDPDKRVDGTPVDVFVEWNGHRMSLSDVIAEKGRAVPVLDFRYGGNERFQKDFKSGCIVCLYSCPGGAIGNHAHSIRDYVRDGVVYSAIASRLPEDGTRVTIVLRTKD